MRFYKNIIQFSLEFVNRLKYNIGKGCKIEYLGMAMNYCIGVDLGGTNISAGIVDLDTKQIVKKASIKTNAPRSCEDISKDIVDLCKRICSQAGISIRSMKWIGVASPGIVKSGVVTGASNLGWKDARLAETISRLSGVDSFAANDANAAAYAEAVWGVGKDSDSLVAITIGTGVGGGVVLNGKIWEGINGFAAEIGHIVVDIEGRACPCGKRGCLEAYSSATAIISESRRFMKLYPESIMWDMCDGDINRVNGATAFKAKTRGDVAASLVIDDFTKYLAMGVSNVINIFQPDIVCIGGGISAESEHFIDSLRTNVERLSFGVKGKRTRVEIAHFLNDAGIIGGALLGLQEGTYA